MEDDHSIDHLTDYAQPEPGPRQRRRALRPPKREDKVVSEVMSDIQEDRRRGRWLVWTLGILALAGLSGTAWYGWQYHTAEPEVVERMVTVPCEECAPAVVEEDDDEDAEEETTAVIDTSEIDVLVLNGTNTTGLAGGFRDSLNELFEGLSDVQVGNAEGEYEGSSVVVVNSEAQGFAEQVGEQFEFEIGEELPEDEEAAEVDMIVILGGDYTP